MEITSANVRMLSKLGQRGTFFGMAIPELAKENPNLRVLTADVEMLSGLDRFVSAFPTQFFNLGIAEQNMIGVAAGLAMEGRCVFTTTYASFIAVRSLEHIRQHLAHMRCNVKVVGFAGGVTNATSGVSHCATEDLAFMRALPNMIVMSAADSLEAYKMACCAASVDQPMYIRLNGLLNCPVVYKEDFDFKVGKANIIQEGSDIAILAHGLMVNESLQASKLLKEQGISCSVIDFHTLKPLDTQMLDRVFKTHRLIAAVEEHSVIGGLGSAVAEYKAALDKAPRQIRLGFPDTFFHSAGSQKYIWDQMGITAEKIADRIQTEWVKR